MRAKRRPLAGSLHHLADRWLLSHSDGGRPLLPTFRPIGLLAGNRRERVRYCPRPDPWRCRSGVRTLVLIDELVQPPSFDQEAKSPSQITAGCTGSRPALWKRSRTSATVAWLWLTTVIRRAWHSLLRGELWATVGQNPRGGLALSGDRNSTLDVTSSTSKFAPLRGYSRSSSSARIRSRR
jgi:hypothetical protein